MATIYDADPNELIEKAAIELAKNENIKAPEWAGYVKTGMHKERAPARKDWWHIRAAAVLRAIYRFGPIGVAKLRIKYGGKKGRGHKTERFYPGSGSIIRKILQQLEKAGYLKKEEKMQHRGRRITPAGRSFLDKIAAKICKGPAKHAPKPKPKAEEKKEPAEKGEKIPKTKELAEQTKKSFKEGKKVKEPSAEKLLREAGGK